MTPGGDRVGDAEATAAADSPSALRAALGVVRLGPVLVLGLLVLVLSLLSEYFLTRQNLLNVGVQAAPIALLALGQLLVILTRGIDLSVGAIAALSGVAGALVYESHGAGLGVAAMLAVGIVAGLANGLLYVCFRIPHPFIVTLGTLNVASGAAFLLSDGQAVPGVPPLVRTLGTGEIVGVPWPIVLVLGALVLMLVVLRRTQYGRWIYAVGGNPEAAKRVGIPVDRLLVSIYAISGLTAALAGIVLAGRTASGDPNAGSLAELQSIAAVIIGGVSFFGGRGRASTVIVGALVLAVIANGLNLLDVDAFWQLIATGVVLILAVIGDVGRVRIETRLRTVAGGAQA